MHSVLEWNVEIKKSCFNKAERGRVLICSREDG